jgi:hypothetical protein
MPHAFFADGSKFVDPIKCNKCGEKAYAIRRAPHPLIPNVELYTFECPSCEHRFEQSEAV